MGFDAFVKGIFDINKIPTKFFFIVTIVGTFVFYAPDNLVLIKFNKDSDLKIYIYVIYLLCSGIFIINCITGFFDFIKSKIQSYFQTKELNKHNKDVIDNLDKFERAVLREVTATKDTASRHADAQGGFRRHRAFVGFATNTVCAEIFAHHKVDYPVVGSPSKGTCLLNREYREISRMCS